MVCLTLFMLDILIILSLQSKSDILIVSITSDKFVNKGEGRPYNDEVKRAKTLAAMKCIDYIFINDHLTSLNYLKKLKPNFY